MKFFPLLLFGLLLLTNGTLPEAQAQSSSDVLVKAKSWQIQRHQLESAFKRLETELMSVGRVLNEDERKVARQNLLDRLIFAELCLAQATDADKARGKQMSAEFISELRSNYGADGLNRLITRAGHTQESFEKEKVTEATVSAVVEREIRPTIKIPSTDIREFYEAYPDRFEDPAVAHAHVLLLSIEDPATGLPLPLEDVEDKKKIGRRLIDRARGSEDFLDLIQRYSDDPAAKLTKGEYKFMRGEMIPEVEAAAFSMKPGQYSDLISTEFGLHIVRLNQIIPAKTRPLPEVSEDIRELLIQRELELRIPEYAQRLKLEQKVEVTDAGKLK
jgi:hypothetical protein